MTNQSNICDKKNIYELTKIIQNYSIGIGSEINGILWRWITYYQLVIASQIIIIIV